MGFIILEGVDGAGKTTLAQSLVREYGAYYRHVGPPEPDTGVFAQHVRDIRRWKHTATINEIDLTVIDRFHLGTWAYGKEFRDSPKPLGDMDELEWQMLEELLLEAGAQLVLVRPPIALIENEWQQRLVTREEHDEYEADLSRIIKVYDHFNAAFLYSQLPKVVYDRTEENAWVNLITSISEIAEW